MDNFFDKACHLMNESIRVIDLRDVLSQLCEQGYQDAAVGFRIGRSVEKKDHSVNFPVADIRILPSTKEAVYLTPAGRIETEDGNIDAKFDITVSFDDNAQAILKFDE